MPFNKSEWWWLVGLGLGMGMGMGDGDGWVGGWVGGHWTLLDNNAPNALPGPLFSMATILFATSGWLNHAGFANFLFQKFFLL